MNCVLPGQLALAGELADHCLDVHFILDHCGTPDVQSGEHPLWSMSMNELAQPTNVTARISGLIACGVADHWKLDALRPYFAHSVDAFGHDRVIWGSDSPVCNLGGGLEVWVSATHALTAGWSNDERAALYQGNA